jgi:hypothetical protein
VFQKEKAEEPGNARTLHNRKGASNIVIFSTGQAILACVIAYAPRNTVGALVMSWSTSQEKRHKIRLTSAIVNYRVRGMRENLQTVESPSRYWRVPARTGRRMQGAERSLVVSVAPEPSRLPHAKSGEASTFLWSDRLWRCVEL